MITYSFYFDSERSIEIEPLLARSTTSLAGTAVSTLPIEQHKNKFSREHAALKRMNMSDSEVKDLTKVFKIPKKEPSLGGAVKGLLLRAACVPMALHPSIRPVICWTASLAAWPGCCDRS
jgi:hypothetical protein